jgi:GNAT superfamily N-acetyltransferase
MEFFIAPLAQHQHHVEGVAERIYRLWGRLIHEDSGMSAAEYTEVVRSRAVLDRVPTTLVALAADTLVGTVSLKQEETTTAAGLSPWVGGLLVDEGWRARGVGKALLEKAEATAARLGYPFLHLSCEPEVEHFYQRLGWEVLRHTVSCGDKVALMRKRL